MLAAVNLLPLPPCPPSIRGSLRFADALALSRTDASVETRRSLARRGLGRSGSIPREPRGLHANADGFSSCGAPNKTGAWLSTADGRPRARVGGVLSGPVAPQRP